MQTPDERSGPASREQVGRKELREEGSLESLSHHYGLAEEVQSQRRQLFEERPDCVLLGPEGTGKTSLLASMARACEVAALGLEVNVVPGSSLAGLAGELASELEGRQAMAPTREARAHELQLRLRAHSCLALEPEGASSFVGFLDTPGQSVFSATTGWPSSVGPTAEVLERARSANWLVLCVDAANPESLLWQVVLPKLVAELARDTDRLIRKGSTEEAEAFFPGQRAREKRLPYRRVLVLLTKIDVVCAETVSILAEKRSSSRDFRTREIARLDSHELALRLDPIRMLQDRMGGASLGLLRSALPETAQLAVGVVSSFGFKMPCLKKGFGPARGIVAGDFLRAWEPFGLREALTFLANGTCLEPILEVRSLGALNMNRAQVFDFPPPGA